MLLIIISIIFFGMMVGSFVIFFKQYKLVKKLELNNIRISRSSRFAAKRDLKELLNSNVDEDVRKMCKDCIDLMKVSNWLFWGSAILIFSILILNAFFRWQT